MQTAAIILVPDEYAATSTSCFKRVGGGGGFGRRKKGTFRQRREDPICAEYVEMATTRDNAGVWNICAEQVNVDLAGVDFHRCVSNPSAGAH